MNSCRLGRNINLLILFVALPALAADLPSEDWPQFRGPKRTGVSTEKGLLKEWPSEGPALVWKCEGVGEGFSSVAVAGHQVFTMGDLEDACYLFAIDRNNGQMQWKVKVGEKGGNTAAGPRSTPTVDGQLVYALGHKGELICVSAKDGSDHWRKNLKKDFKGHEGGWNYTESPLVDGEKLVVTPGGSEAAMVALNKKTGAVIWKGVLPKGGESAGYSSIIASDIGGVRQYIQLMSSELVSFSADKGELLWRYGVDEKRFGKNTANIPTPIVKGDQVFATAGYARGGALLTITNSEGKFDVKEEYWNKELKNKHGGVILVGDHLYGDQDDHGKPWCADFKTGEVKWSREKGAKGSGSASITAADGMLYIHYNDGWVALVDPTVGYREVSAFKVPNTKDRCWAHPVVAGGKLYIREKDVVWCYDVKAK